MNLNDIICNLNLMSVDLEDLNVEIIQTFSFADSRDVSKNINIYLNMRLMNRDRETSARTSKAISIQNIRIMQKFLAEHLICSH